MQPPTTIHNNPQPTTTTHNQPQASTINKKNTRNHPQISTTNQKLPKKAKTCHKQLCYRTLHVNIPKQTLTLYLSI